MNKEDLIKLKTFYRTKETEWKWTFVSIITHQGLMSRYRKKSINNIKEQQQQQKKNPKNEYVKERNDPMGKMS